MPGASRSKWPAHATLRTPQAKPSYCRRGAVASMVGEWWEVRGTGGREWPIRTAYPPLAVRWTPLRRGWYRLHSLWPAAHGLC
jgi:hypothetical protein